mgnify:CR=1 FL=1
MLTAISVVLRILSNSTANLYQKKAGEIRSPLVTNLLTYAIMSAICAIPALFVNWSVYSAEFWGYVIIAGALCTVGTVALIEALKIGELSVLAPINSYKSVIGLISAIFILGEFPSFKNLVCIIFIIAGSYFVLNTNNNKFSLNIFFRKDVRLRFFALLCSGIEAAFLKKIIVMSSYGISLILWCFSGFLCSLLLFVLKDKKQIVPPKKIYYSYCLVISVMLLIMQLTTNYVFSKIEVGSALALFQLSSLVSIFYGYKLYHEKNMRRKLIGTFIMIISAAIILAG